MPPKKTEWYFDGGYVFTPPFIPFSTLGGNASNVRSAINTLVQRALQQNASSRELVQEIQSNVHINKYVKTIHQNGALIYEVSGDQWIFITQSF